MKRLSFFLLVVAALFTLVHAAQRAPSAKPDVDIRQNVVQIKQDAAKHQYIVDVLFRPFTTYCYGPEFDGTTGRGGCEIWLPVRGAR